jgi:hypothetical protein
MSTIVNTDFKKTEGKEVKKYKNLFLPRNCHGKLGV